MQFLEMYQRQLQTWPKNERTNLCLGSVAVVQILPLRLWCKERMNDLLLRINQYGLREHATQWNFKWVGGQDTEMEQRIDDGPTAQKRMVMTLLCGYLLAVVVFLGELLVGWFRSIVNIVSEVSY